MSTQNPPGSQGSDRCSSNHESKERNHNSNSPYQKFENYLRSRGVQFRPVNTQSNSSPKITWLG
jgi:hypothetical protein